MRTLIAPAIAAFLAGGGAEQAASSRPVAPVGKPAYHLHGQPHAQSPLDLGSPGFDRWGNGCVRHGGQITRLGADGTRETMNFTTAAAQAIDRDVFAGSRRWDALWDQSMMVDSGVQFDVSGTAYTLVIPRYSNLVRAVLLVSKDVCRTWHAVHLAGRNATMEKAQFFTDSSPPTIISYEYYGSRSGTRLWLERFAFRGVRIEATAGFPQLVASDSRLSANHSGGGNSTMTSRDRIVVVYPAIESSGPGTLTMAREFDRRRAEWIGPAVPLGRSTSIAHSDAHDTPAIACLPNRRIIVVTGAHHALFRMYTSKEDTIASGWHDFEIVGDPSQGKAFQQYSYPSLNVSRSGMINIIARAEGDQGRYELVQLRKRPDGIWAEWPGSKPHRILAMPNRPQYVAWRQRVTEDADGILYLHFAFFPNMLTVGEASELGVVRNEETRCQGARCWFNNAPTLGQVTLISRDDGLTWE